MSIVIRNAQPADAADMAEVLIQSWAAAYDGLMPADFIREKNATRHEQFKNMITGESDTHFVIVAEGRTAGVLTIGNSRDDDADESIYEVNGIYLHPDYYRQGIGTQAMDFVFDKARNLGKSAVTLWVLAKNINSIRFYEKIGFTADGASKEYDYGQPTEIIRMRREI